jgi:peptidoglycan/LPS O-acetylase OafA/YrhL
MQFPMIDVLRAMAALLVMVYHVTALGQWGRFSEAVWGLPFRQGWIGVDLFLVISGFVITLSAAKAQARDPAGFKWAFMQRRLRRLLPLYVLTCVIFVLLVRPEILSRPYSQFWLQVISHALFLQNLTPYTHGVINGVTWSLALEMQFYVALVLSVGWLVRLGAGKTLLLLTAIAWVWRYGTTWVLPPGQAIPHLQVIYTTQLPGTLDEFGVGIALALVVHNSKHWLAPLLARRWRNCLGWLVFSALCLTAAGAIFLPRGNYWSYFGMVVFWRTLLAIGFGAALAAMISCPFNAKGLLRPWRYLGTISYGLYLWHFPVLISLLTLPGPRGGRLFVVLLSASIVLASLSWHLMEKHWIDQRHGSKGGE